MSYRSVKRILGENSLERKCRILFGLCMLALVGGSFFWVLSLTEGQVNQSMRNKSDEILELHLLEVHTREMTRREEYKGLLAKTIKSFARNKNFKVESLVLNARVRRNDVAVREATDEERAVLQRLKQATLDSGEINAPSQAPSLAGVTDAEIQSVFGVAGQGGFSDLGRFEYFRPVHFTANCISCHMPGRVNEQNEFEMLTSEQAKDVAVPIYFMKVSLPDEAKNAINRIRAIMLAAAIVLAFLATGALYAIIRYVIVKPLQHLRNVSDEVIKGNMEIRSNLNTGDEFEELSKSYNRMLRHLTDIQRALESANVDLDRKVDEQAQLNMKLYELNQIKSDFLANMSHELRTPLTSIIGFSEVLSEIESLNEKQRGWATNIQKNGLSLLDLINDILDLAKLEAGKMEVHPSEFSILHLISELADMVRAMADDKRIHLAIEVRDDLSDVFLDQVKVRQVLTNLLSNAIKFTPEGGRICCRAEQVENHLQIQVEDTGVGIAEEDRAIIFEKFRQGSQSLGTDPLARNHAGTGLGLSIVKELCVLQGGSVALESEVGKGSVFTVRLPMRYRPVPGVVSESTRKVGEFESATRNAVRQSFASDSDSSASSVSMPLESE